MKFIHLKTKKPKFLSIIIVPHSEKVKQVKLPIWLPKFFIFLVVISIASAGLLFYSYLNLKDDYAVKINSLNNLKEVNAKQKTEIDTLKMKTSEIEKKLSSVINLQQTVRDMVGLEQSDSNKESTNISPAAASTSRGGTFASRGYMLTYDDNELEVEIDLLSEILDQSQEDLSNLITDVDKKMKYLDAKPNLMPTSGRVTSGFGYRKNPFGRGQEFHSGIDIANSSGTKIVASGSGIVTYSGYNGGYGRVIAISHGYGYQSIYGHNKKLLVEVGDKVEKGQVIAYMGSTGRSTGTHVHFEVRLYGKVVDPNKVINSLE